MKIDQTNIPSNTGLRRDYLSGPEVLAQSVGTVCPSAVPGILIPVVFAVAGNGTWLVLTFTMIALLFVTAQLRVFGARMASPGALYAYVSEGLGPLAGIIAAWSLLIAYFVGIAPALLALVNEVIIVIQTLFTINPSQGLTIGLAIFLILPSWTFAHKDIRLSARVTMVIEVTVVTLIIFTIGWFFIHRGTLIDTAQINLQGFTGSQFRQGLALAFFCFTGFETACDLGSEARDPFRTIPRVLIWSICLLGIFFIASSYGLVAAFQGVTPGLDQQTAPLTALAQQLGSPTLGTAIAIGLCFSFAGAIIACLNATGRLLYTLAHRGLFHASAAKAHATNATPHIAIAVAAIATLITAIVLTLAGVPLLDGIGYLGTICSFGFLFAYGLVCIAAPVYLKRRGQLKAHNVITATIAVALLIVPLVGSLYPVPNYPSNILPYIFLGLLAIGIGYFLYIKRTDPARLLAVESELLGVTAPRP